LKKKSSSLQTTVASERRLLTHIACVVNPITDKRYIIILIRHRPIHSLPDASVLNRYVYYVPRIIENAPVAGSSFRFISSVLPTLLQYTHTHTHTYTVQCVIVCERVERTDETDPFSGGGLSVFRGWWGRVRGGRGSERDK